jgi:arabinofuranosyltransferase
VLGFAPAITWTIFSFFYYGFPFPNTAYAKLIGVSHLILLNQGLWYFWNSLIWDPITLIMIAVSLFITLKNFRECKGILASIGLGIFLYLTYILYIGGDFMTGRFFSAPLLLTSIIFSLHSWQSKIVRRYALLSALLLASASVYLNVFSFSGWLRPMRNMHGIADERSYYYNYINRTREFAEQPWRLRNEKSFVFITHCGNLGVLGLDFGPRVYLSDQCALADPLLARLPLNPNGTWRIGHAVRDIPSGYWESLESQSNFIVNPKLKNYYDIVSLITRGPIFNIDRLKAISKINLGLVDKPDLSYLYDYKMPTHLLGEEIDFSNIQYYEYFPPNDWGWDYPHQESMLTIPLNRGLQSKMGNAYLLLPSNHHAKQLHMKLVNQDNKSIPAENISIDVNGETFHGEKIDANGSHISITLSPHIQESKYLLIQLRLTKPFVLKNILLN